MLSDYETALLETLAEADVAQTIARDPNSTIEPPTDQTWSGLPILSGFELGATLGEGGMGIVRTATQLSLGRRVAVKTLRVDAKTDEATLRLLREAWITGAVEHPNIVPVYDLGLGPDGVPFIVLKQIEGLAWSELIADAVAIKDRFGADDVLEHNLRILVQLCQAVSLAHARGIVHRDLKPENVMIGRFGEVYLVDWGLAVSLKEDPSGRLPLASQVTQLAGTPAYMAPEMLGAIGSLSERTDVYLLGAILYEILTGRPPHLGSDFREIVSSVLLSAPRFPPGIPRELIAIAERAMSRLADDRYASASELRERLEWYLRHRGSLSLSAEASIRVDALRSLLARGAPSDELRDRVHHLFAEARFGFRQAMRVSDDNNAARAGLRDVTELVVAFELERGAAEAAAAALAELEAPPAELAARVAAAISARAAEKARVADLEKLDADMDPSVGRRTRATGTLLLGVMWILMPQWFDAFDGRYSYLARWMSYVPSIVMVLVGAAVFRWGRELLMKSALNRRSRASVMMGVAMQMTLVVGFHVLDLPERIVVPLHVYCWTCVAIVFSVLVDCRFFMSAFGGVLAFVGACASPAQARNLLSAMAALVVINAFAVWGRRSEDVRYFLDRLRRLGH